MESVDLLDKLDVPAFKIASADITNYPLLKKVAKKMKPVIMSTGAATIGEIQEAVKIIKNEGNSEIVLLHCILSYPTPYDQANLQMIKNLRDLFPDIEVGWSDHVIPDDSIIIPVIAAVMGATVIEKHFTLDRTRKGNDHFHSMDTDMLITLNKNLEQAKSSLGQYLKDVIEIETNARKFARRSIGISRDIKSGEEIKEEDLIMLRPGTGIHPKYQDLIIGKHAKRDIKSGYLLEWEDVL